MTRPPATVLTAEDLASVDALRRENFYAFTVWVFAILHSKPYKHSWHVAAMCFAAEELARGRRRIQLIALPPRYLKSIVAIALCAWVLGRDPAKKILVASYGGALTAEHTRLFRTVIGHPDFARMFPACKITVNKTDVVKTSAGGFRRPTTPDSAATGLGADFIIIDDLTMVKDARSETVREAANSFIDESLMSRFDDKNDIRILAVQQRTHERDVIGHLMDKPGCDALVLPAIAQEVQRIPLYGGKFHTRQVGEPLAPRIEGLETLGEIADLMGPAGFASQYLQNPVAAGGNRVQWAWLGQFDTAPARNQLEYVVQSWDTALREGPDNDYTVAITLGFAGEHWFVLDVLRRRINFSSQLGEATRLYNSWQPDKVLIEDACTGGALAEQLAKRIGVGRSKILPWRPRLDKEERVEAYCHRVEQGLLAVPDSAHWLADFRNELTAFPFGRHDDQVDALFQFLEWHSSSRGRAMMNIDPKTGRARPKSRPHGTDFRRYSRG